MRCYCGWVMAYRILCVEVQATTHERFNLLGTERELSAHDPMQRQRLRLRVVDVALWRIVARPLAARACAVLALAVLLRAHEAHPLHCRMATSSEHLS